MPKAAPWPACTAGKFATKHAADVDLVGGDGIRKSAGGAALQVAGKSRIAVPLSSGDWRERYREGRMRRPESEWAGCPAMP